MLQALPLLRQNTLPIKSEGGGVIGRIRGLGSISYMTLFHGEFKWTHAIESGSKREPDIGWLEDRVGGALNPVIAAFDHCRSSQ